VQRLRSVEDGLRELERRSAEVGQPVTVQRRAALRALVGRTDHPTAEAIHADVSAELPGVSKATVYRALDNLVRLGLARRVHHPGSVARYDGNTERHHHLVCRACSGIEDFASSSISREFDPALDSVSIPELASERFEVHDVFISFQGICRACRARSRARRRSK
jgi:Fur family peroxide stress response transcriptional regulator